MKKKEIEKLWSIESGSKKYRKIWKNRTASQIKSEYKSKYKYKYKNILEIFVVGEYKKFLEISVFGGYNKIFRLFYKVY